MMGTQNKQESLFSYRVNLNERMPQNHPLRKIKQSVDFSFVRQQVAQTYGIKGNVSVDPEVILKLMFLLFFDDIKSERELMRMLPYRLDYLWFLDFGLDDPIPDHSVLSKARARWGPEVFEEFFVTSVMLCIEAGLVEGSKLHFDGSLVDADASTDSVRKGPRELISALKFVYRAQELKLDEICEKRRPSDYQPVNDCLMSTSDPDAAIVSKRGIPPRPRYKNHRAVDDLQGVITAVETTSGDVEENSRLIPLIEQSECNTGVQVETAVADSQYGTVENFRECEQRGIASHMSDLSATHKDTGRKQGIFDESDFKYDAQSDTYTCPAGKTLKRRRHKKKRKAFEYSAGRKACNSCELRERCTRSVNGRSLKRHEDQELIDSAKARSHSRQAKQDRVRRKHLMEGSFGDAANNHGFKRSRWRGLLKQRIQDWIIASCQNLRILLNRVFLGPAKQNRKFGVYKNNGLGAALSRFLLLQ